ncbi:hypothetical protein [Acidithiobacillus sulfuriphilus]|uniref:Uncharacterized protein n=1 Tax=Acidithiobacillus sulfuriphilus TaxID=1867749 RepID=A0ACD5HKN6_9PROT|nr:hypothetical protein [Acidithiobacillus sulfuriphilus]
MDHSDNNKRVVISRRKMLWKLGMIVGAATVGATFDMETAYAFHESRGSGCGSDCNSPPKHSKAFAQYQDHPKGGLSCVGCVFFSPGKAAGKLGSCSIVSGEISPYGWCRLFVQRQAPQFPGDGG